MPQFKPTQRKNGAIVLTMHKNLGPPALPQEDNSQSSQQIPQCQRKRQHYTAFIEHMKTLPPSTTDLEIRTLDTSSAPYFELISFVEALTQRLRSRKDYEFVLAWMRVFLKIHGETVAKEEEELAKAEDSEAEDEEDSDDDEMADLRDEKPTVKEALQEYREEMKQEAGRVSELVGYCGGVLGFLRSSR
ncbi:hypothetical protein TWF191_007573 [Orbilia oligospora]|uniref:WDR36/Utp21 C-terminal domain-containing protein n=1 Tax=Orbilia oligospora TaxID=2813651 RepID=A0A7C8QMX7_ORBOL|nr:hypothetical protein TWF191_007573 [Orbilia oligospora]